MYIIWHDMGVDVRVARGAFWSTRCHDNTVIPSLSCPSCTSLVFYVHKDKQDRVGCESPPYPDSSCLSLLSLRLSVVAEEVLVRVRA